LRLLQRLRRGIHPLRAAGALGLACALMSTPSCVGSIAPDTAEPEPTPSGSLRGEFCEPPEPSLVVVRAEPDVVVVPVCPDGSACVTRQVKVIVDPDFCQSPEKCS